MTVDGGGRAATRFMVEATLEQSLEGRAGVVQEAEGREGPFMCFI